VQEKAGQVVFMESRAHCNGGFDVAQCGKWMSMQRKHVKLYKEGMG
jgi:hypothetical protein